MRFELRLMWELMFNYKIFTVNFFKLGEISSKFNSINKIGGSGISNLSKVNSVSSAELMNFTQFFLFI